MFGSGGSRPDVPRRSGGHSRSHSRGSTSGRMSIHSSPDSRGYSSQGQPDDVYMPDMRGFVDQLRAAEQAPVTRPLGGYSSLLDDTVRGFMVSSLPPIPNTLPSGSGQGGNQIPTERAIMDGSGAHLVSSRSPSDNDSERSSRYDGRSQSIGASRPSAHQQDQIGEGVSGFDPALWGKCAGGQSHGKIRGVSGALVIRDAGFAPPEGRVGPPVPRLGQSGDSGKEIIKLKKKLKMSQVTIAKLKKNDAERREEMRRLKKKQDSQDIMLASFAKWMSEHGAANFTQMRDPQPSSDEDDNDDEQPASGESCDDDEQCTNGDDCEDEAESGDE